MICYPIKKRITFSTPRRGEQCLTCRLHAVAWGASFDWFAPRHGVEAPRIVLDRTLWPEALLYSVRNLGVMIADDVEPCWRRRTLCFHQLRQLWSNLRSLTFDAICTLVMYAYISSLDGAVAGVVLRLLRGWSRVHFGQCTSLRSSTGCPQGKGSHKRSRRWRSTASVQCVRLTSRTSVFQFRLLLRSAVLGDLIAPPTRTKKSDLEVRVSGPDN